MTAHSLQPKDKSIRRCIHCREIKPATEFRLVRKGKPARRTQCNDCHRERDAVRRRRARNKANGMTIQKASASICRARSHREVAAVVEALSTKLGGPDGLAEEWVRVLEETREKKRYRRFAHMAESWFRLLAVRDKLQAEWLANLPDESVVVQAVQDHPHLIIATLLDLGWRVEPREVEDAAA